MASRSTTSPRPGRPGLSRGGLDRREGAERRFHGAIRQNGTPCSPETGLICRSAARVHAGRLKGRGAAASQDASRNASLLRWTFTTVIVLDEDPNGACRQTGSMRRNIRGWSPGADTSSGSRPRRSVSRNSMADADEITGECLKTLSLMIIPMR